MYIPESAGLPKPERARGQEHTGKAEAGEKMLKPSLRETRVTWQKLDCLKPNPDGSIGPELLVLSYCYSI